MSKEETRNPEEAFLKKLVSRLSKNCGVYVMKNSQGEVLYIGKAKNLRARVRSYFSGQDTRLQIPFLITQVANIETVITENERQALIMEADLIKKFRPHYNVRLKDDRGHLIVRVDLNVQWPRLEIVRQIADDGALYLGPFAFSYEIRGLLDIVRRTIPLRTCSDSVLRNRVRPCLEFQIKRCLAPCCLPVDREQYLSLVQQAIDIIKGKNTEVIKELEREMNLLSEAFRYEDAAVLRDRIALLKEACAEKFAPDFSLHSQDAIGLYREGTDVSVVVMVVRNGRLYEARKFKLEGIEIPDEELLSGVLGQIYEQQEALPHEVLLPFAIADGKVREELWSENCGRKVSIVVPQRGAKRRLIELALENAKDIFQTQNDLEARDARVLEALRKELELPEIPRIIECVDISHFQGGETVGAVVSFRDVLPDKSRYRRFVLKTVQGKADDFASMREVMLRHFSRQAEENELADLLIVDGGPAQLAQVLAVKKELSLPRPIVVALAKERTEKLGKDKYLSGAAKQIGRKPERVYLEVSKYPKILKPMGEATLLLTRIRDEAHRFVITFHRAARLRRIFSSPLDMVAGLGPKRRALLLKRFGSLGVVRQASAEEISEKCSFPLPLAERILNALRK